MSLQLLVREHPHRAVALATERHALIIRPSTSTTTALTREKIHSSNQNSLPKCTVEFVPLHKLNLSDYRALGSSGYHGTLGLVNINADVFLCVISGALRVATVRPGETVQRILTVDFFCLNKNDYDTESHMHVNQTGPDDLDPYSRDYAHEYEARDATLEHPCLELKRLLSSGTFYYSVDFDLTNRLQNRSSELSAFDVDNLDEDYLWNSYMIDPLIRFRSRLSPEERKSLDSSRILTSAIRGFVLTVPIPASSSPLRRDPSNIPSRLTLLSRLSCRRAGTRFNSRGIDDDGYVANFVETESVLWHPTGLCFSYAQVRGSVPIFWEQSTSILPGQQRIQITRSAEATQPAFNKHLEHLELTYGTIHILNLLSETKPGEVELTARYNYHVQHSPANQIVELRQASDYRIIQSQFDFHAETKGYGGSEVASMVRRLLQDRAESFGYFLCSGGDQSYPGDQNVETPLRQQSTVIMQQEGVFRTNCLDCLDRTNMIQTILSQMALNFFLAHRSERAAPDFWARHSSLWADNGDALSKIYAGTGALKSSFTRHGKLSISGAIADARKSATRMYMNTFADKARQNTMDVLLGRLIEQSPVDLYDPINDYVDAELRRRAAEYSTTDEIQIWTGTLNLNGRDNSSKEDLGVWLCPRHNNSKFQPDIVAVGFQEIVELSPQQIMSTDPIRRVDWEEAVRQTLNGKIHRGSNEEYVLLRSGQLVGAALMIFVKSSSLKMIRNVEGSVKKTGMSGIAGNKGAVAIRMDYANTRICLVTAHLAAGFANYEERNRDFRTISHGLRFLRNRSIEDHDAIIWLGDFNYRIGLSYDKVHHLVNARDLGTLYENDQLNLQMIAGRTFPHYAEAQVTFMPTYKYNNGTDDYDNSEKARIPAWCDRILSKGHILKQITYETAPLRFSDHRPVSAVFRCSISNVDANSKEKLSHNIYQNRKSDIKKANANIQNPEADEEDDLGYDPVTSGLPPASSNRRKWWLDNGLPVRSNLRPPSKELELNGSRPSNPFTPTNEPDWVPKINRTQGSNVRPVEADVRKGSNASSLSHNIRSSDVDGLSALAAKKISTQISDPTSTMSLVSNISRKAAPPIPKKPNFLSTNIEQQPSPYETPSQKVGPGRTHRAISGSNQPVDQAATMPLASQLATNSSSGSTNSGPRLLSASTHLDVTKMSGKAQQSDVDVPRLPPRQSHQLITSSKSLLDNDNEDAKDIASLQPSKPD